VGQRSFLHVHAPSDSHPEDRRTRARIFREVAPLFVTEAKSLPVVVGDFNCVQDALDTTINHRAKVCRPLQDFLATFPLVDVFRVCHPLAREYTFRRPGLAPSRLDRAYIPPFLLSDVVSVWHVATTSDHSALCASFRGALAAAPPPPAPKSYWKLNVSVLSEPEFGPLFEAEWAAIVADRPLGVSSSLWWDATAKPFFRDFCTRFSKMMAHRRRESRNFFQVALEAALAAEDWATVRGCRARLEDLDKATLRGRRIRVKGSPAPGGG
jgi:hypothetical protein